MYCLANMLAWLIAIKHHAINQTINLPHFLLLGPIREVSRQHLERGCLLDSVFGKASQQLLLHRVSTHVQWQAVAAKPLVSIAMYAKLARLQCANIVRRWSADDSTPH